MDILPDLKNIVKDLSKHVKVSADLWYLSKWKEKDCPLDIKHLDISLEKYFVEREFDRLNKRNTTILPTKEEVCPNVIVNQALQQSIDRDIGAAATALDYMSLGISATAEAVTQTDLIAEISGGGYTRRQLSVGGTRTRTNQTMKLGHSFNDTQVGATLPVTLREVGIHWHVSSTTSLHSRVVMSDFPMDTGDLFVALMTELQENGTL
jgi:hypothetical protein